MKRIGKQTVPFRRLPLAVAAMGLLTMGVSASRAEAEMVPVSSQIGAPSSGVIPLPLALEAAALGARLVAADVAAKAYAWLTSRLIVLDTGAVRGTQSHPTERALD
jgi:hypothetical protein